MRWIYRLRQQLRRLQEQRREVLAILLISGGMLGAVTMAALAWHESARQEAVLVVARDLPAGSLLSSDDLEVVWLPQHRPAVLRGISDRRLVIGQYSVRELRAGDLLQPTMLQAQAPTVPRYANGRQLTVGMVPFAFSLRGLGPISENDLVNLGFSDSGGAVQLCGGTADTPTGQAYACRLISRVRILAIDTAAGQLYLEVTPYQAQSLYALQAAGVVLWAERYAADGPPLPALSRLESRAIERGRLEADETGGRDG
jgi:hypothetical protein